MNSHNNGKQDDSTSSGQEGRDDRADERKENLSEESTNMNDENEFEEADTAEADRSEARDEGPELTDLLKQASRLLRREFFAAAAAGKFGHRGQAIREQVDAVVDDALSDEEFESLTDSLGKIVDALGRHAEGANDEWNDRREFAGRRGFAARREFAHRFAGDGRFAADREHGSGPGFVPEFERDFGPEFAPRRGRGRGFGPRNDRSQRHEWGSRGGWGSRGEWDKGLRDEEHFDHCRSHEECGPDAHGADHQSRGHRAGGRRRGMGRMVGAAFEHGFAAGYKRGVRS